MTTAECKTVNLEDLNEDYKQDLVNELMQTYPTHSYQEISMLVDRCFPDIDGILDLLDKNFKNEGSKREKKSKLIGSNEKEEKRRVKALERQEKK